MTKRLCCPPSILQKHIEDFLLTVCLLDRLQKLHNKSNATKTIFIIFEKKGKEKKREKTNNN